MNFSATIKSLRNKQNLTQKQLAQKLDLSSSTVAMWEQNQRKPDFYGLIKLAEYFDVTIDELVEKNNQSEDQEKSIEKRPLGIDLTADKEL